MWSAGLGFLAARWSRDSQTAYMVLRFKSWYLRASLSLLIETVTILRGGNTDPRSQWEKCQSRLYQIMWVGDTVEAIFGKNTLSYGQTLNS